MSTRGSTYWDDDEPMDWHPEPRQCPFCTIPAMICGCPTGNALTIPPNIILGQE